MIFFATLRKINAELGTSIMLIEHRLEEVLSYADRVMVMEDGKILALAPPRNLAEQIRGERHVPGDAGPHADL